MPNLENKLEQLYLKYNQYTYIDPDPLQFLHHYPDIKNREIAGFVAACFAYGRVEMIIRTVAGILEKLSPEPFRYLKMCTKIDLQNQFKGFRYRFASDENLINLLWGIKQVLDRYGSLKTCFCAGVCKTDETLLPGLQFFTSQIRQNRQIGHLLADPAKKSACKRSHLFLRWMVRKDNVDPGGWEILGASRLIIPLDTHMHRAGQMLAFTQRKSTDIMTALEITSGFKNIAKEDPVKYDFCLTRFGIRKELDMDTLRNEINDV